MTIQDVIIILQNGGVIAYPTEAIYGLGCDPFNEEAVKKLFAIKQRPVSKGLILIAADYSQIAELIVPGPHINAIKATWPGPNTWVFPATEKVPVWIRGDFSSVAIRITDHPLAKKICQEFNGPLVSTSANISSEATVKTWEALNPSILNQIDYLVKGEVGNEANPSIIRDAMTQQILRC